MSELDFQIRCPFFSSAHGAPCMVVDAMAPRRLQIESSQLPAAGQLCRSASYLACPLFERVENALRWAHDRQGVPDAALLRATTS